MVLVFLENAFSWGRVEFCGSVRSSGKNKFDTKNHCCIMHRLNRTSCSGSLTNQIEIICVGMCDETFLLEIIGTESTSIRKNRCSVVEPRLDTDLI